MVQALMVAILGWIQCSSNPIGWWLIREPLMAGLWVGVIYGKPVEGLIIGAAINVAFLGWNSTGGANPSDLYSAGLLGTAIAIQGNISTEQAVVIAISLGVIGNYAWILFMSLNSFIPSLQDKCAEEGNIKKLLFLQASTITVYCNFGTWCTCFFGSILRTNYYRKFIISCSSMGNCRI